MNRMVLLVDSDATRRERLREALFAKGLTALGSGNTEQAVHILVHNRLSLVIAAESDWQLLNNFCFQVLKRWPKTKLFALVDHLPQELLQTAVTHLPPHSAPEHIVSKVMEALKEKQGTPELDLDIGDFFEESQEGPEASTSASVPPSIDFGAGISLDDIISGAIQIPKAKKKTAPAAFDFEIPIPPLKSKPPLPAVQIDSSELELIVEEEDSESTQEAPAIDLSSFLEAEEDDEGTLEEELDLELDMNVSTSGEAPVEVDLDLSSGDAQGAPGAVWLMKIASEKRSGRLFVAEGPAKGVIYFAEGEGVWAEFENGVDGLRDYLLQHDIPTPSGLGNADMGEGEFLWTMAEHEVIEDDKITATILDIVRERILQIAFEGWCDFRFEIDEKLSEVPPMMSVHPFGLILESRQKELAPAALIGLSSELEAETLNAGPASDWIGNSLDRFLNNMNLSSFLADKPTVGDFFTASSLGPITGTLMILALRDTQVIMTKTTS